MSVFDDERCAAAIHGYLSGLPIAASFFTQKWINPMKNQCSNGKLSGNLGVQYGNL